MEQRVTVIVNPRSKLGATGSEWPAMERALRATWPSLQAKLTTGQGHATALTREALAAGSDLVIAVGGDGTNNEVVNGFFDGERPIAPDAVLGFIPQGTGGDLRKTLRIGKTLEECLPVLVAGNVRAIDLGVARFVGTAGDNQCRVFVNITSFGLGGLVDRKVNNSSKALGGKASFFLGTLKALLAYRNQDVRLRVDDGFDQVLRISNVAVANGQYFGGGMWVAPHAKPDDGMFDVVILGDFTKSETVFGAGRIYKGTHLKLPKVRELRGRHVEATSEAEVLIDMDGEQPGRLPISLDVLPGALKVIAPPVPA